MMRDWFKRAPHHRSSFADWAELERHLSAAMAPHIEAAFARGYVAGQRSFVTDSADAMLAPAADWMGLS